MPNKSIKFAHKMRGLGLGDKARLAPYFERQAYTMDCKSKILLSWLFITAPFIAIFVFGIGSYELSALCFIALMFRNANKEKHYWRNAGNKPGIILKSLFAWSLLCLTYIMFKFYSTNPVGTYELSGSQWLLFGVPILFVYVFYEIQLYKHCEKYYNA